jgi:hypothetical protein
VDAAALSHKVSKDRMLNPTGASILEQIIYKKERGKKVGGKKRHLIRRISSPKRRAAPPAQTTQG